MGGLFGGMLGFGAERALASEMVAQIAENISPKLMSERRHVLSAKKITRFLEQAFELAEDHQKKMGLGMIRRAVLANSFRWELKAAGYPEDFIGVATEALVVELTVKGKSSLSEKP